MKALRHIANIRSVNMELMAARQAFEAPRALAQTLPAPSDMLNQAQIDHSEAEVIRTHLESKLGKGAQVSPSGDIGLLLAEGVNLASKSEAAFRQLGDKEREIKALKVKVLLLAHDTRKQRYRESVTLLSRLEREVSRNLR